MDDRMKRASVEAIREMVFWDGEERRETEISGMLSRLKGSISGRQRGIRMIHEGKEVVLYNPELHD